MNQSHAEYIRRTAANLGINPSDLATAISYETAGTFDPWKAGPTTQWGQHRGLIQWGEPQRAQYGVTDKSTLDEQYSAIEKYLKDRGLKPGSGMLDLYSTINAGSPGRYNASDANNGGAPGTVADKVAEQMVGHRIRANAMLGGENAPAVIAPAVQQSQAAAVPADATYAAGTISGSPSDVSGQANPGANAGSLDLTKLAAGLQGMQKAMAGQQQNNSLDPVQISAPMPSGLPSAQRLAAVMASLGR